MANSSGSHTRTGCRPLCTLTAALLLFVMTGGALLTLSAQNCTECQPARRWGTDVSGTKKVCFDGSFTAEDERRIAAGAHYWNSVLSTRENAVYFDIAAPGDMSGCAVMIALDYGLIGTTRPAYGLFTSSGNGSTIYFNPDKISSETYNYISYAAGHEFYHVLGYDDLPEHLRATCDQFTLMAGVYSGHPGLPMGLECGDQTPIYNSYPPSSGVNCATDPAHPDCSPLVIDTKGNGFSFVRARSGVLFDIDADGDREQIGWTKSASDDAWLAMDRNGNGVIDNGSELFGNFTRGCDGADPRAANGFEALKLLECSCFGASIQDGIIDARDAAFQRLLLWQDLNQDGISTPNELVRMTDSPLTAIDTNYRTVERVRKGNAIRQASFVIWGSERRAIVDVWLDTVAGQ